MPAPRSERPLLQSNSLPVQIEVLRLASEISKPGEAVKEENQIPLFWRVFGGTMLSITALIVMTAYQGLSGNLADLAKTMEHLDSDTRKEMSRLSELQGELVRKEDCDSAVRRVQTQISEIREDRKMLFEVKELCEALLEQHRQAGAQKKSFQRDLQDVRESRAAQMQRSEIRDELTRLRERMATLEGRQSAAMPTAE